MKKLLLILALTGGVLFASAQNYPSVLNLGPLDTAPAYFYINTKIPFSDSPAPQLQVTGYNYGSPNKAIKITLGWYVYQNAFFWSQYKSELGYYNPSQIRLGTYNDAGVTRVRIEIANDGVYWSSLGISAFDIRGLPANYSGWSYAIGSFPGGTGNITTVSEFPGLVYTSSGNLLVGKNSQANDIYKLDINGKIRANEIVVNTTGADYVFENTYKLMPLNELEEYVLKNKHLPGIPDARTMQQEGAAVGDLLTGLLSKVEELSLHLIENDKQSRKQKDIIKKQQDLIEHLSDEIRNLSKDIKQR